MVYGAVADDRAGPPRDRIVFLGHATVLLELDGVRVLTDPLLRARVWHLRRHGPLPDAGLTAGLDGVLISHLHHDHLDLASLRSLGADTQLFVPAGAGAWLRSRGFTEVTELSVGEVAQIGKLTVTAVEARHDGRRRPRGPEAETLGYLISGTHTVYFAGDTELFEEMTELADRIDAALLPIAGWGPTLGPGHMDPLHAARAAALIRPRLVIPVHWGTLLPVGFARRHRDRLGDPAGLFARHVAQLAPGVEVRTLTPGQQTAL
jgi:L-ascorbate metabolism protein UlaG (beta-lactamase superfamily)